MEPSPTIAPLLAGALGVYLVGIFALSFAVRSRIHDQADFLVAGRRLPLSLAWMTLLGTWFGAGTLLTAADEVRRGGLQRAALDPWGAGLCLILAGLFFARPLWEMGLLTVSDFFRRRFGPRAELLSALVLVPSYFGWIAVQLVALANLLQIFFGWSTEGFIVATAAVAMAYTLLGGMWSVTLTDAVQIGLVLVGLVVLAASVLHGLGEGAGLGAGLDRLLAGTPPEMLRPIPTESLAAVVDWLAILAIGALGNLPAQDLMQRVFAARSARVARRACLVAGALYLVFGALPLLLGLAARLLMPESLSEGIVPALAHLFLTPSMTLVFVVALVSAVLSTLDSAILSPAGVLSQNVFLRFTGNRVSALALNRLAVVLVTVASVGVAFWGESAYTLLEDAYELPLVGLFVPMTLGLYGARSRGETAALASILTGFTLWIAHAAAGWTAFLEPWLAAGFSLPSSLGITAASLAAYLATPRAAGPVDVPAS